MKKDTYYKPKPTENPTYQPVSTFGTTKQKLNLPKEARGLRVDLMTLTGSGSSRFPVAPSLINFMGNSASGRCWGVWARDLKGNTHSNYNSASGAGITTSFTNTLLGSTISIQNDIITYNVPAGVTLNLYIQ